MRDSKILRKTLTFIIFITILFNTFVEPIIVTAVENKNQVTKEETSHDIAIVFDNSGSMYNDTDRWSQALYAMEVFASMLNYGSENGKELDRLTIYPMAPISIGKNRKKISKLEITDESGVKQIEKIYSPHTSQTIIKPAYTARNDLKDSKYDEKWLILLTDGAFFYDEDSSEKKSKEFGYTKTAKGWPAGWLEKKLKDKLKPNNFDIKFQYIGFGEALAISSDETHNFYTSTVGSNTPITRELITICNRIFHRDKLDIPSDGIFKTDVSMSKIIAFVQGKKGEIELTNLNNKTKINGKKTLLHSGTEGTGTKSFQNYKPANISGQSVIFENCSSGTYKMNYPIGADVEFFYEPDVRIKTTIKDEQGKEVDTTKEIEPGKYKVDYGLVDAKSNKPVNSEYIQNVDLNAEVSNNNDIKEINSGDTIELKPDAQTSIRVNGSFQGKSKKTKYTINNDDDATAFNINVKMPSMQALELKFSTEQFGKWFKLSDYEKWKSIKLEVKYGGKPLSDNQISQIEKTLKIVPKSSEKLSYKVKPMKGKSAFEIVLGKNSETGKHSLEARAFIKDKFNQKSEASDSISFEIQWYSQLWRWLFWILIVILIALAVLWWMSRKVLPKNINVDQNGTNYMLNFNPLEMRFRRPTYSRKAKSLTVSTPPGVQVPLSVTCKLKAIDRRWTKSKNRRMQVVSINTNAETVNIAGGVFQYEDRQLAKKPSSDPILSNSVIKLERTDIEGNTASFAYKIRRL